MGWIASLGVAALTGVATLFGAGTVASLVVDWYNVSSFEGGSGFFVVGMALIGGLAGVVIGLVAARVIAARPAPTFVKALGAALATVAAALAVIAATSWIFADIAPRIEGEELHLITEIRWPPGAGLPHSSPPSPSPATGVPYLRLGALQGRTVRRFEGGIVFIEDARQEDGRWIVPGAVPVFTRRGARLIDFGLDGKSLAAFDVPLPRYPGKAELQWSEWLPNEGSAPAAPERFTYRFKVIRKSEPVRTESIGPFEVDTVADYFYSVSDSSRLAANATFRVRYRGQPLAQLPESKFVSTVAGSRPALFVVAIDAHDGAPCTLIADQDGAAQIQTITGCGTPVDVNMLTSNQAHFTAARSHSPLDGWIDRLSFARPGLFQLDAAIVDTRDLTLRQFVFPESARPDAGVPPLDLSPDERSFVWLAQGYDERPRLGVTNWYTGESYLIPIDRARMRFNTASTLDPDWIRHHFQWKRGAEGTDVLAERANFTVLPYKGHLELGKPGEYQAYTLRPGGEGLRTAIVDLLVREPGGERIAGEPDPFQQRVRLGGKTFSVWIVGSPSSVSVSMDAPQGEPQIMSAVGAKLDAALASGKYDALFVADPEAK